MYSIKELASEAAETHDIDYDAALDLVEDCITQVEAVDEKPIDRDDISRNDAEFLRGAIAATLETDSGVIRKMDELFEAADAYADALQDLDMLHALRDQAIIAAVEACCTISDIMRVTRLSRDEIDDICTRWREQK